jgi:hypothetical protein
MRTSEMHSHFVIVRTLFQPCSPKNLKSAHTKTRRQIVLPLCLFNVHLFPTSLRPISILGAEIYFSNFVRLKNWRIFLFSQKLNWKKKIVQNFLQSFYFLIKWQKIHPAWENYKTESEILELAWLMIPLNFYFILEYFREKLQQIWSVASSMR